MQKGKLTDKRSDKHAYYRQTNKQLTDWQTDTDNKNRLTKQKHGPGWSALAYMKKIYKEMIDISNIFELI